MVSGSERIADVADAIDVIEQLADRGAPGARPSQRVVRSQLKAAGEAAVAHARDTRVARTGFGTKKRGGRENRTQRGPTGATVAAGLGGGLVRLRIHRYA